MKLHLSKEKLSRRDPCEFAVDIGAMAVGGALKLVMTGLYKHLDKKDMKNLLKGVVEPKKHSERLGYPDERLTAYKQLHDSLNNQFETVNSKWSVESPPDPDSDGTERTMLMFDPQEGIYGSRYFLQRLESIEGKSSFSIRRYDAEPNTDGDLHGTITAVNPSSWETATPIISSNHFMITKEKLDEKVLAGTLYADGIHSISDSYELIPGNVMLGSTEASKLAVTVDTLLPLVF